MKTSFVYHPENDMLPPTLSEEAWPLHGNFPSVLYEISAPFDPANPNSKFWLTCFKCGITANLGSHQVSVQGGEKIDISPSILCPRKSCENHYYIKNSEVVPA